MADRYPGYDVLSKRNTPSWNEQTRRVIDARVATPPQRHTFLTDEEFATLRALCDCIVPQPQDRTRPVPVAALVDEKLSSNHTDGYRNAQLPPLRDAWRRGLAAIEAEAGMRYGGSFPQLEDGLRFALLKAIQAGDTSTDSWGDLSPRQFFKMHLLHDVISAYYSDPHAWSEIGFGGPASPRGYVRMNFDRRDPWEATETKPGHEQEAREENRRVGR